jgi:hypothetical protein
MGKYSCPKAIPEVCRVRSTKKGSFKRNPKLNAPFGKERIYSKKLDPNYVVGFIDGEGSFSKSQKSILYLRKSFKCILIKSI